MATGLQDPVAVVADPTQPATFMVVEQGGLVRVVRDGMVREEPFLDLRRDISSGGERGLLGLALAPDYAESRRFFVNFTNRNGDTVIARFRRHADDPAHAPIPSRGSICSGPTVVASSNSRSRITTAGILRSARTATFTSVSATAAAAATR